jgi:hypothetical protein
MTKTTKTLLNNAIRLNAVSLAFDKFEDHGLLAKEKELIKTATDLMVKDLKKAATKREMDVLRSWGQTRIIDSWSVESLPIKVEGRNTPESAGLPMSLFKPKHADGRRNWKPNIPSPERGGCMVGYHYQTLYVVEACIRIPLGQKIEAPTQVGKSRYYDGTPETAYVFVRGGRYSTNPCDPDAKQPTPATPFTYSEVTVKVVEEMVRTGYTRWHNKMKLMEAAVELIGRCKTLEELVAAWPEADVLRKHVVTNLPSPVLASDFNLLLENMKQRGVKVAA